MMPTLKTYSPIDNSLYVERSYAKPDKIELAVSKAKQAQERWKLSSLTTREKACQAAVDFLVAHKDILGEELSWQMGRPIRYAKNELRGLEERARYMIEQARDSLADVHLPEKLRFTRYIKREPLGLVFVIAPWNYPYLTAVNTIIPAIMAGNCVLLKHSAQTPLVAERFAEAFKAADLPAGVFQYLHLTHEQTKCCIQSSSVDAVCFTGSVTAGVEIEQSAAGRFIPIGLELGGKDPAYIRADANLDEAVALAIDGAFFNSGQSCCGIERIYVHVSIYDAFIRKAVDLVKQYQLGRSDDPNTTLGPMVRASAADFVREQIKEAVEMGARAHINPHDFPMDKPGSPYLAPQVLTQVNHNMRIMWEESFGPVVGIMPVANDEEAIELMNDSDYGLTAAVFTKDLAAGVAIGERLNTGTFFINRCDYLDPALAWTGIKKSGRGCSLSTLGYDYLTRPKSFHIKMDD
ncbi:aldehyde dehydrogenase family protein [Legionella sp. km772]|uniref:aldehyde dehydrogenase family protein n=1 Tax=Legionella sp. km772 TaxID=2498111 RepID=UPI000F8F45CD|nr:aldehyde dehydrogenase family protein [Legionella sp. km772]RUR13730.1 aldehyde dehydrogenase family protein [Legionella sp. km772]